MKINPSHFMFYSACERTSHNQVLSVTVKEWWLGLGPELCHHCPQQPLITTSLHSECQLCPNVSSYFLLLYVTLMSLIDVLCAQLYFIFLLAFPCIP